MLASALDKVATLHGEVLFERESPTFTKLEATLGDRIDLRISGQHEEPFSLNEEEATVFLISSLMKQALRSPNKSTMINDVINIFTRNAANDDFYTEKHRDSFQTNRQEGGGATNQQSIHHVRSWQLQLSSEE